MVITEVPADRIVEALLQQHNRGLCLLDSCGVGRTGSNRLIAGLDPVEVYELKSDDPFETLESFDELLSRTGLTAVFTISYDLGLKLQSMPSRGPSHPEPDIYVALFDTILFHDYSNRTTVATDKGSRFDHLFKNAPVPTRSHNSGASAGSPKPNFTRAEYLAAVDEIKELIRAGETYQVNLTQQLTVPLRSGFSPFETFLDLRRHHPAPFAAFIDRGSSKVVSASPEQFVTIQKSPAGRTITSSPIKGTRPRGTDKTSDEKLRTELLTSEKDRAENTMIVDLMRNDLGRVCEFGSIRVEELCRLDTHPTLFHLVSEVSGRLRKEVRYSDIIAAIFPCGSITGAPKIRTMEVIDRIETVPRSLSMGAIGCRIASDHSPDGEIFEMSVAIRTMVIRDGEARFNVGGGITIDSDPEAEYDESMLKAKALLSSLSAHQTIAA